MQPAARDGRDGLDELLLGRVEEVHEEVALVEQEVVLDRGEAAHELLLGHEQLQQRRRRPLPRRLDPRAQRALVGAVDDRVAPRLGALRRAAALAHDVQVLAAVEDELRMRLEEGGQLLPGEREAALPVGAVEVALQLLLLQRGVGLHHELAVRVVAHAAVDPRLQHLEKGHRRALQQKVEQRRPLRVAHERAPPLVQQPQQRAAGARRAAASAAACPPSSAMTRRGDALE